MITKERLLEVFDYKDGDLYWKVTKSSNAKAGNLAGFVNKLGYSKTSIDKKQYFTHRLIFLMHYGFLPKIVDHKDKNPLNNKIENLRAADRFENCQNAKTPVTNKSGIKGVNWHKKLQKWNVQLNVNGKKKNFGYYNDIDYAKFVVEAMRYKYHRDFASHA